MAVYVTYAIAILTQLMISRGFLLDGLSDVVTVSTSVGEIVGKLETSEFDGKQQTVKVFLGIPYAEPPIGDGRFRKPTPKAKFSHTFHAFDYGPACLQVEAVNTLLSEDCLFLNIFTPERSNASSNIPVMVWIHGGWFQTGASNYYHGDVLSAFGDVIVVTINYRLAQLGFLRTDEDTGNFGLWDQQLALKWVKDNIASFGGNVNNITIFGESAGSVSVAYQTMFAGNKNLFHRAIAQSGGINSPYGFATNGSASKLFDSFSTRLNCTGNHAQIMICLRNKTTAEILNAVKNEGFNTQLIPSRDNAFVPKHPRDMLKPDPGQSHDFFQSLDLIMGCTSIDGALYLSFYAAAVNQTDIENLVIPKDVYESYFIPNILSSYFSDVQTIPQIVTDLAVFEYTNWNDLNENKERVRMLIKMTTDTGMFAPAAAALQLQSKRGQGHTYLYEFSSRPAAFRQDTIPSWLDGPTVANHGDDILATFGYSTKVLLNAALSPANYNITDGDIRTSKAVMTMWTNFAKTGNPNEPNDLSAYLPAIWTEYNATSQSYLDITPVMTSDSVKPHFAAREMEFWLNYLPSFFNN